MNDVSQSGEPKAHRKKRFMTPLIILASVAVLYTVWLLTSGLIPSAVTGLTPDDTPQLRACSDSPNCVCSCDSRADFSIDPVAVTGDPSEFWNHCLDALQKQPGFSRILESGDGYIHALFRTPIMRYPDDVEMLLDTENQVVHIKSSSRVGYSDLGANRRRLESLVAALQ